MSNLTTITFRKPITSARILDNYPASDSREPADVQTGTRDIPSLDLETEKAMFSQTCQVLSSAVDQLNELYNKIFVEHREEIARLSVEIARKILVQKVTNGDYEIESIVKETLKNTPSHHDVVVHLHPEDLARCRKAQDESGTVFDGVRFVSDAGIERAECLLETPKGIVQSLIDENLERIGQALMKVE